MKKFSYKITDELGVHARPAGELVKLAKSFESEIKILKDEKEADAKKIFGVMGLAIKQGNEITITANGTDEDKAIDALGDFFNNNL